MNRAPAAVALTACLAACGAGAGAEELLFKKKSLYRNIAVVEEQGVRCLRFSIKRRGAARQSCIDVENPDHLVLPYTELMLAGLLLAPDPERILLVGLGGGTLVEVLESLYPHVHIDAVEIDPAVVDVAYRYFDFEPGPGTHVHTVDGRVFVRRALARGERYDFILLDAFNGDYIPEHLMTREFLEDCRELLTENGVLTANTFSSSRLYSSESVTYEAAFGWLYNLRRPLSNRIVLTGRGARPSIEQIRNLPAPVDARRYGVDFAEIARLVSDHRDWNPRARVLTDQYAPANLLRGL